MQQDLYGIPGLYTGNGCPNNPGAAFCTCPSPIFDNTIECYFDKLNRGNRVKLNIFSDQRNKQASNDTPGFLPMKYEQPG